MLDRAFARTHTILVSIVHLLAPTCVFFGAAVMSAPKTRRAQAPHVIAVCAATEEQIASGRTTAYVAVERQHVARVRAGDRCLFGRAAAGITSVSKHACFEGAVQERGRGNITGGLHSMDTAKRLCSQIPVFLPQQQPSTPAAVVAFGFCSEA